MPGGRNVGRMSLPERLSEAVGDETVVERVALGGDDVLIVTPTRSLVYRADGLLSDEAVEEYPHDVDRLAVSTGRRKSKVVFGYGLDDDETLALPSGRVDEVIHPLLAGVLSATGVTEPGESVVRTFRFSELTLVVTDRRLVKHVGSAVWDDEFEEFPYADLTDLDFEEGTVATAVVLAHDGRSERFKTPNESARAVREALVDAVCEYHDVESVAEFRVAVASDDGDAPEPSGTTDFGEGPDPLSASPVADAEAETEAAGAPTDERATTDLAGETSGSEAAESAAPGVGEGDERSGSAPLADDVETDPLADDAGTDVSTATEADASVPNAGDGGTDPAESVETAGSVGGGRGAGDPETAAAGPESGSEPTGASDPDAFEGSPFESAGVEEDDLVAEVAALRRTVEAQSERLDAQADLIERLIEELRRGR